MGRKELDTTEQLNWTEGNVISQNPIKDSMSKHERLQLYAILHRIFYDLAFYLLKDVQILSFIKTVITNANPFLSVQFSRSVMSDSVTP